MVEPAQAPPARLDSELVRRGLARSRAQARDLVAAGAVVVDGRPAAKPSVPVLPGVGIELVAEPDRWVGRAAYKLLAGLEVFGRAGLSVRGKRCLDVGASTGGFTQVLLEAGAAHVTSLDVGHGQLATSIATDRRVTERSRTNIRDVALGDLGRPFDLVVADVSFISLRLVVDRLREQVGDEGDAVLLVKPQFEVGRERLARTGVVTSVLERRRVLVDAVRAADGAGLRPVDLVPSPIRGGDGNHEYLLWATARRGADIADAALETMVGSALDADPSKGPP